MANEAVKRYSESSAGDVVQDYTVANGTGIEKGAICKLTDPRTASLADEIGCACAGIAAREKIASDGRTRLSMHKRGYFDVYASGAITVGAPCEVATSNYVRQAPSTAFASGAVLFASGAAIIGYAEETAADNEQFLMRLNL